MQKLKVYIISGTLGAGKTTVSKLLAKKLDNVALISADIFMDDMLLNKDNPTWEDRLKFVWTNTISTAKNALALNLNVVIEGVVENELPELQEAFSDFDLYYCILMANERAIGSRIENRGDSHLISRSMEVLKQYQTDKKHKSYLFDTSNLSADEVLEHILKLSSLQN